VRAEELADRKHSLSPKLLGIPGVSGVGLREGVVAVYLESEDSVTRHAVQALVDAEQPGTPIGFYVSGAFRKRPDVAG
jgi:hypothetical protein